MKVRGQLHALVAIIPGQVSPDGQLVLSARLVLMEGIISLTVSKKKVLRVLRTELSI